MELNYAGQNSESGLGSRRSHLLIALTFLALGALLVVQLRSQRPGRSDIPSSPGDQATYISQLYESNLELQNQANALQQELSQYQSSGAADKSALTKDLQNLRMANGAVDVTGPGVTVTVNGDITTFDLQDLVNELRNASAEAVAVNGVRVVTRSAIVENEANQTTIDSQPITRPYSLEAIGEPDTLYHALQRKGGLVALLQARDSGLQIQIAKHDIGDTASQLILPRTKLDFTPVYGQPVP